MNWGKVVPKDPETPLMPKTKAYIGKLSDEEHFFRNAEFMLGLTVSERLKFGKRKIELPNFRKKVRIFDTMQEYRDWLNTLPKWMRYGS